jgi:hypothetical protein
MGFVACSLDEPMVQPTEDEHGPGAYIQFVVSVPATTSSSRAGDGVYTENETTGDYSYSSDANLVAAENKVHAIYAYFSIDGKNLIQANDEDDSKYYLKFDVFESANGTSATEYTDATAQSIYWKTVIKRVDGKLLEALKSEDSTDDDIIYNPCEVYLLCNKPVENVTSVSDLMNYTFEFAKTDGDLTTLESTGMPMAARSIDGVTYDNLALTKDNVYSNPYVLNYEVERSYARIYFKGTNKIPLYDTVTDPTDDDTSNKSAYANSTQIGNIKLLSYYVINKNNSYYSFRQVGVISDSYQVSYPAGLMDNGYSAKYGPIDGDMATTIIEPFSDQKTGLGVFSTGYWNMYGWAYKHTNDFKQLTEAKLYGEVTYNVPKGSYEGIEYVAENAMANDAQTKTQATGVVFKVMIVPNEYYASADPGLTSDDFGTAAQDGALYKVTGAKYCFSDLYYYDGVFFADLQALSTYDSTNTQLASDLQELENFDESTVTDGSTLASKTSDFYKTYGIKYYKGAEAYYEYFIRHNNNYKYEEMADMEFAIVRNNSYDLTLLAAAMSPYTSLYAGSDPSYDDPDEDNQDPDGTTPDTDPDFPDPNSPIPCEEPSSSADRLTVTVTVRPWTQHTITSGLSLKY